MRKISKYLCRKMMLTFEFDNTFFFSYSVCKVDSILHMKCSSATSRLCGAILFFKFKERYSNTYINDIMEIFNHFDYLASCIFQVTASSKLISTQYMYQATLYSHVSCLMFMALTFQHDGTVIGLVLENTS